MARYSVMTYNIGGYEILHEIPKEAMSPDAEYIYVTDDHTIKSETWKIVYEDSLKGDNFAKCFQIRFNPFKYVNTDIVIKIEGSFSINKDLTPIIDAFEKGNYDAAVMIHPHRNTISDEYFAWNTIRGYPMERSLKLMNFISETYNYDIFNYKGLYQTGLMIQRNDAFNNAWNLATYDVIKHLAPTPDSVERVDQTFFSVILNTIFPYKKIMPICGDITNDSYFTWNTHNSNDAIYTYQIIPMYLFNKEVQKINF